MFCPKCGKENAAEAIYCSHCGKVINRQKLGFISRHKSKLIAGALILFFFVFPLMALLSITASIGEELAQESQDEALISGDGPDKIALINIDGVITDTDSPSSFGISDGVTSSRKIKKTLRSIEADADIKALLIRVNSPGGSAAASEEIYQELESFKSRTKLPIISYFSDIAASGGYYVSMASDRIIANPNTITGSIGVIISYLNIEELSSRYGVKNIVYKSGEFKDILNEFKAPTQAENEIMQSLVTDTHETFINVVSKGRKMPKEVVVPLANGRVYSANQAVTNNLIDQIGTLDTAIAAAQDLAQVKTPKVIEYGKPDFWETFLGAAGQKFNINLLPELRGSAPDTSAKLWYLFSF